MKKPTLITDEATAREFPKVRIAYRPEGLDMEAPELFNSEGLSFEEMALAISEDVIRMNSVAVVKSRFSQSYLELSRLIEKGISELASCCITKAVFEKQGINFPKLNDLDLSFYYGIVSGHFRKCHAAISETTNKNQQFWTRMLDMEFRWYNLARRLKATADRIQMIRDGKINIDKMLDKMEADRIRAYSTSPQKANEDKSQKALPSGKAISFPVMGDFLQSGAKTGHQLDQEAVPARIPAEKIGEEPKKYASMKQRKKAERLTRKHAAISQSSTRESGSSVDPYSRQMLFDPAANSYGLFTISPEDIPIPTLLSKGIPVPERV